MSKANEPACPNPISSLIVGPAGTKTIQFQSSPGLTKREAFAMAAMQGDFADGISLNVSASDLAKRSRVWIMGADALLAALEESK